MARDMFNSAARRGAAAVLWVMGGQRVSVARSNGLRFAGCGSCRLEEQHGPNSVAISRLLSNTTFVVTFTSEEQGSQQTLWVHRRTTPAIAILCAAA
jgi:hypothetical protein